LFPIFKNILFRRGFARLSPGSLPLEVSHHLGAPVSQDESTFSADTKYTMRSNTFRMVPGGPCLVWKYDVGGKNYVIYFVRVSDNWRLAGTAVV